jgi:glycosyltransferase involved in cell wall biosynthesis
MSYNFVVFSLSPWNINYGCNIKDISIELARQGHRVLYIDVPLKRKERWFMKDRPFVKEVNDRHRSGQSLKQIGEGLWHYIPDEILESVNSVNSNSLFDAVNYINNKRFTKSIRKAIRAVGFDDYVLVNDNEIYNGLHLKKMLNPPVYMYYLRDMLSAFVYWKKHVSRLEPELIGLADVVVTNSEYLSDYAGKFNGKSYYVGQGCDVTQYMQRPPQAEIEAVLKDIPRPIVGYVGALNAERLNISLIHELALKRPELSFVLVGPEDQAFQDSPLHEVKNIYFLGKKDVTDLPKYIHGFDVAINPQVLNEITIGNYPRKVDEYLAAGVPVVATKTHAMNPFRQHVYLGETAEEYSALITQALQENSPAKSKGRVDFAAGHTWENNVLEMLKALEVLKASSQSAV